MSSLYSKKERKEKGGLLEKSDNNPWKWNDYKLLRMENACSSTSSFENVPLLNQAGDLNAMVKECNSTRKLKYIVLERFLYLSCCCTGSRLSIRKLVIRFYGYFCSPGSMRSYMDTPTGYKVSMHVTRRARVCLPPWVQTNPLFWPNHSSFGTTCYLARKLRQEFVFDCLKIEFVVLERWSYSKVKISNKIPVTHSRHVSKTFYILTICGQATLIYCFCPLSSQPLSLPLLCLLSPTLTAGQGAQARLYRSSHPRIPVKRFVWWCSEASLGENNEPTTHHILSFLRTIWEWWGDPSRGLLTTPTIFIVEKGRETVGKLLGNTWKNFCPVCLRIQGRSFRS